MKLRNSGLVFLTWMVCAGFSFTFKNVSAAPPDFYQKQLKPLLQARCYACHSALKQEGNLRLDTAAFIRKGGDSGAAIVPGQPAKSELLRRISSPDKDERMPPEGDPLKPAEIKAFQRWIAKGAKAPKKERADEDPRKHWAFIAPIRPALPEVKDKGWVRNGIDNFIAAQRERRGVGKLSRASRATLLRRVYLDLIGLPPTRQELRAFLADKSQDAYAKVVDRLLKSPRYGERWGRHWMDVWRYSDWYGRRKVPDVLNSYAQIWRWRDWIIRSINEDKGYDRMVMEMLAADEIDPGNDKNVVATGFVLRNFYRWNYNTWMKDSVEHTSKAFLALTMNCCHCHAHKYDPISNREYFQFRAFFEPLEVRHDRVAGEPDPGPYPKYKYGASYKPITSGLVRVMDEKLDAKTFMYTKGEARNIIPGLPPVSPGGPVIAGGGSIRVTRVKLPPESWYPGIKRFVQREEIAKRKPAIVAAKTVLQKAHAFLEVANKELQQLKAGKKSGKELAAARKKQLMARLTLRVDRTQVALANAKMAAIQARIHADMVRFKGSQGDPQQASRAAVKAERLVPVETAKLALRRAQRAAVGKLSPGQALAIKIQSDDSLKPAPAGLVKQESAVKKAIAFMNKPSQAYTALSPKYPKYSTGRRTALAKWIANRKNPLTARVAANHIWSRHFGRAIVKSTENFGRNGDQPTHPQLLDWLALELMDGGWKMKRLHRLIVTSATYQQASAVKPSQAEAYRHYQKLKELDRDNVSYWRFNPRRVEAEAIRDSVLHVAGRLDTTMYGKEISQSLGLTNRRRSVYFDHHGEGRMTLLDLFDAADPCDCYRRSTSVRPQQALALSNSQLAVDQSRWLARTLHQSLIKTSQPDRAVFVRTAFEQVLCREPNQQEIQASVRFLAQQEKLFQTYQGQLGKTKTKKKQTIAPSTDPIVRAREGLVQALFSHSDFVTLR